MYCSNRLHSDGCHTAVFVTPDELTWFNRYGLVRVDYENVETWMNRKLVGSTTPCISGIASPKAIFTHASLVTQTLQDGTRTSEQAPPTKITPTTATPAIFPNPRTTRNITTSSRGSSNQSTMSSDWRRMFPHMHPSANMAPESSECLFPFTHVA